MGTSSLYVVATPLGNLEDLSARAARVLRDTPVVAAEDTRRTRGLLAHLGSRARLVSFHAHSPPARIGQILELLSQGDVALVSDAGTPVVSDPGSDLVAAVRAAGHRVVPIPGPSAAATALSASGLPGDRYLFLGFLPRKGRERRTLLRRVADEPWPVVCFEAANRLVGLLEDLAELAGWARRAVVARELTKLHEEVRSGTLAELAEHYRGEEPRGEVTLVIEGQRVAAAPADAPPAPELARALLRDGVSRRDAAAQVAARCGLPRNAAYRIVMEADA